MVQLLENGKIFFWQGPELAWAGAQGSACWARLLQLQKREQRPKAGMRKWFPLAEDVVLYPAGGVYFKIWANFRCTYFFARAYFLF